MSDRKNNYKEWLQKAEEDEFAGKVILEASGFSAPACFHFQQMAEKILKALLIFHDQRFPKIHDLVGLATLLEPFEPGIEEYKEELILLDRYYVETRYPGDYPEFSHKEAQEAFRAAQRIKEFVITAIEK